MRSSSIPVRQCLFFGPLLGLAAVCAPLPGASASPIEGDEPPQIQVGAGGIGAGWDRYVEYVHCFADRVQTDCASELPLVPRAEKKGEGVAAWVSLDCNGRVTEIIDLEGRNELVQAVRKVLTAEISAHHSFGLWPVMMARDLGKERQIAMEFSFPVR